MASDNQPAYLPLAAALEVLGQGWSLLVVRLLLEEPHSFEDMVGGLPSLDAADVARHVEALTAAGVIVAVEAGPDRVLHTLSALGRGLAPVVTSLETWSQTLQRGRRRSAG